MPSQEFEYVRDNKEDIALKAMLQKNPAVQQITDKVDIKVAGTIFNAATVPLSVVERCYIMLFLSGASTGEIARVMHVERGSVYTMKYRLKKKFPREFPLPF